MLDGLRLGELALAAVALTALAGLLLWQGYRRGRLRRAAEQAVGAFSDTPVTKPKAQEPVNSLVAMACRLADADRASRQPPIGNVAFNPRLLVKHGGKAFAGRAAAKGLRFRTVVAANVPRWVRGDPSRIVQVFMNLLDNAVKFTGEGVVRLEVRLTREGLRFTVHDTGVGTDSETLNDLLHAETPASDNRGVAVSRRLVEVMGGALGAESEPRGGSTFWFSVPVEIVEAAPALHLPRLRKPPPPDASSPGLLLPRVSVPGKRILIVEGDIATQVAALWGVRSLGYLGEVVSNGKAALESWRQAPFDLVLLDYDSEDGRETAERLRRETDADSIPIVAMTAADEPLAALSVQDRITKPVCLMALAQTLEHWLVVVSPAGVGEATLEELTFAD